MGNQRSIQCLHVESIKDLSRETVEVNELIFIIVHACYQEW